MKLSILLLATVLPLSASAANTAAQANDGVHLSQPSAARKASLLGGEQLETSFTPSAVAPLRMLDGLRFDRHGMPGPLDDGGGVSNDNRQLLSLLLGLLIGFGVGHLIAGSRDGFVLWLIIDIAVIAAVSVLVAFLPNPIGYLASIAFLAERIIQGIDAYQHAGGGKLIQLQRDSEVRIASAGNDQYAPATTNKVLALAF